MGLFKMFFIIQFFYNFILVTPPLKTSYPFLIFYISGVGEVEGVFNHLCNHFIFPSNFTSKSFFSSAQENLSDFIFNLY